MGNVASAVKDSRECRLATLQDRVVRCTKCPRLVSWRKKVAREKVARFRHWSYWGKPVPSFGDPHARLLLVGLAPAAHGGNRTGRIFTGDRSGDWLFRALYKFGFANQPTSVSMDDGLKLVDCYVTAAARCAPPGNKLLPKELRACRSYLLQEIEMLDNVRVIVALGKVAFDTVIEAYRAIGKLAPGKRTGFAHGVEYTLNDRQTLVASFHPSQQNTFTGKLTEPMFDSVFRRAKILFDSKVKNQK